MLNNVIDDIPLNTLTQIEWVMFAVVGLMWNVTYIGIVYRGFRDRTIGMPLVALALNFGWEAIMSFVYIGQLIPLEVWMNRVWVVIDCLLLAQELMYGKATFAKSLPGISQRWHYPTVAAAMIAGFFFTFLTVPEWNDYKNGEYAAFLMNVVMSALFITMLLLRGSIAGQSIYIALAKLIGTSVFGVALFGVIARPGTLLDVAPSPLELYLGILCLVLDTLYVVLLVRQYRIDGYTLWTRRKIAKDAPAPLHPTPASAQLV